MKHWFGIDPEHCKQLFVDGLKFVDSMVKLTGFVEENGMDRGGRNIIGERKELDEVSK